MKNYEEVSLDETLNFLIERDNISQHFLVKKLNINKSTLHNYLNGVLPQGLPAMIKICEFFNITLDELVFGIDDKKTSKKPVRTENEERYEIIIKKITKD